MKKFILTIFLVFSLGANVLFANPIQNFVDSIAYSTFKTAWPTATYESVEIFEHRETSYGHEVTIRLIGKSKMYVIGNCPLKLDLLLSTNSSYIIKDVEVLKHNAIMQPPFKTVSSIKDAVIKATKWEI